MPHKINISGIIGWDVTAKDVKAEFKKIGPTDEVGIELNSPGGSVFEGIEISNAIRAHKGNTDLVITGLAASMGSLIALSADHVSAFDNATFMIHNASTFEWGDHRVLRKTANVIEALTNMLAKAYVARTGKEISEIRGLMDGETWFFGNEILDAGFIDQIIDSEGSEGKEDAVAYQKLVFIDSVEKMKKGDKNDGEIDKLAALFTAATPKTKPKTKTKTNEENMTLDEFLAQNPSAQNEFEAKIKDAKAEFDAELKERAKKVLPIIESGSYDVAVTKKGIETITGERSIGAFKEFVGMVDYFTEKEKSNSLKNSQPDPTPADPTPADQETIDRAEITAGAKKTAQIIGV